MEIHIDNHKYSQRPCFWYFRFKYTEKTFCWNCALLYNKTIGVLKGVFYSLITLLFVALLIEGEAMVEGKKQILLKNSNKYSSSLFWPTHQVQPNICSEQLVFFILYWVEEVESSVDDHCSGFKKLISLRRVLLGKEEVIAVARTDESTRKQQWMIAAES